MREIKFRAWHTEQKRMFSAEEMAEDQLTLLPTGKFINVHTHKQLSRIYDFMIPLQFTGLHDKNGKEIYEGDIRGGYYFCDNEKIEFLEVIKDHLSPHVGHCYYWESIKGGGQPDFMETEIIGNIHENPELLNQEV